MLINNAKLDLAVKKAKTEIENSGLLARSTRNEIKKSFYPTYIKNNKIKMGRLSETYLSWWSVNQVSNSWAEITKNDINDPSTAFNKSIQRSISLSSGESFSSRKEEKDMLSLIHEMEKTYGKDIRILSGYAVLRLLEEANFLEELNIHKNNKIIEDENLDPDQYDPEFLACAVYSGGFPWSESVSMDKTKEFWNSYIDAGVLVATAFAS